MAKKTAKKDKEPEPEPQEQQLKSEFERPTPHRCPACNHTLLNVNRVNSLCPKGCGGLFPRVPHEVHKETMKSLRQESTPEAVKIARTLPIKKGKARDQYVDAFVYRVEGAHGIWRRVKREGTSLTRSNGHIVATDSKGSLIELARWTELEQMLSESMGFTVPEIEKVVTMKQCEFDEIEKSNEAVDEINELNSADEDPKELLEDAQEAVAAVTAQNAPESDSSG